MATQSAKPIPPAAKHPVTAPGSMISIPEESRDGTAPDTKAAIEIIDDSVVVNLNHSKVPVPDQGSSTVVSKVISDLLQGRITIAEADNVLVAFWQEHADSRQALTDTLARLQVLGERLYQNTTVFMQMIHRYK